MRTKSKIIVITGIVMLAGSVICKQRYIGSVEAATNLCAAMADEPHDPDMASSHPNEYAWKLFAFLNTTADPNQAGRPEEGASLCTPSRTDVEKDVVWESWALASGQIGSVNYSEVYLTNGKRPKCWNKWNRDGGKVKFSPGLTKFNSSPLQDSHLGEIRDQTITPISPGDVGGNQEEVRLNYEAYTTIRLHHLYNTQGIKSAILETVGDKKSFVDFPAQAKEVKAGWVLLCDALHNSNPHDCDNLKAKYYWRTIGTINDKPDVYGLAALHILTHDIDDNWFWADFIHEDCVEKNATCFTFNGWYQSNQLSMRLSGPRPELKNTRWKYYRLNGTQTGFGGKNKILANRVLENGRSASSCITCHAYAGARISQGSSGISKMSQPQTVVLGRPDPKAFLPEEAGSTRAYTSSFDWSMILRAQDLLRSDDDPINDIDDCPTPPAQTAKP